MRRTIVIFVGMLLLPLAVIAIGCSKSATPNASQPKTTGVNPAYSGVAGDEQAPVAEDAKITAALAELPAGDRALALKQKVCPVSGEVLGEMGAPVKVDVQGHAVFICCDGCREKLLAKPDEYLAKINK